MSIINYAIEINTEVTGSADANIGLTTDGYIRLITGRPGYDGTPTYPVWEDDSNNIEVWYEGILLDNAFSSPNRRIDIENGGDYGTVSGFSFKIHNAMKFWKSLEDVDISILNSDIQVYCIIDDKFYYAWAGIIDNDPYEETETQIRCSSNYRKIHKAFPPNQISPNIYPSAKKTSYGNTIPVCLGNIPFAQLFNTSGKNTNIVCDYRSGFHEGGQSLHEDDLIYTIGFENYYAYSRIDLVTRRKIFTQDELAGNYLRAVSGDNAETDRLIQITANNASVQDTTGNQLFPDYYYTRCWIASSFDTPQATVNNYAYDWFDTKSSVGETWWFEVLDAKSRHIVSNHEINEFKTDSFNQPYMYNYDKDKVDMIDAHGLITNISFRDGRDSVELLQTDINKDGTITYMVVHGSLCYSLSTYTGYENISDMNRGTEMAVTTSINLTTSFTPNSPYSFIAPAFKLSFFDFDMRDASEIYAGIDLDVTVNPAGAGSYDFGVGFEYLLIDNYGRTHTFSPNMGVEYTYEISTDSYPFSDEIRFNFLPTEYYKNGTTGLGGTTSIFGEVDNDGNAIRDYLKLPDDMVDMIKTGTARSIEMRLQFSTTANTEVQEVSIRQVGIFSYQETQTGNNALYVRINGGEKYNMAGNTTDSVYGAIYHILESYDNIAHANIDYGNLATTRTKSIGWSIGRQITQQKNSIEYLKSLCQYGFLGMFQKRDGNLKVTAYRENQSSTISFTNTNILRNSIKNFKKTPLLKCYNEYKLYWGYNPGSKKYDKSIGVTKVDQSVFPDYLTAVDGAATEITSPNLVQISFNGDGSGKIEFDADVSGTLSVGDYITYYLHYGDTGVLSSWHVYFAYVSSVDTTDILYTDALLYPNVLPGTATYATIYKNASGTPLWMTYVEGLHSYGTAKKLWEMCNYSYTKTKVVKSAPDNLTKSDWFYDYAEFNNLEKSVVSVMSAPYMYLENLIEWSTLPKNQVSISIPLNATNITLELLDYIDFTDPILTNNVTLYGWITKIAIDMNKSIINLKLTLASTYYADMPGVSDGGVIIETGDASDTITESGSQTDTITES